MNLKSLFSLTGIPRKIRRKIRSQAIIALAFLLLGLGNVTFGQIKRSEYRSILKQARVELKPTKKITRHSEIFAHTIDVDKQSKHIKKIKSRIEFYTIAVQGGCIFIIIGITLIIIAGINKYTYSSGKKDENNE